MKKRFSASILILSILGNLGIVPSVEAISNHLIVELDGLKNKTGQVCLSLFSSSQGFPDNKENALQTQCIQLGKDNPKITFENLIPGNYAVAVFHDANSDQTLNLNSLGIPTEGFGFSRNPTILAGPPQFNDTAVVVANVQNNIQIKLQYLWNFNK
ncbi:DUF2141 domain-containing protein [Lyngbya sp. PCC 8106]|uniref:DUF2141 domain-containing protein n=1 Tax=Lyngbya sp. (strain PCC 8106) TaxID=313612 RepID=UPI0000EAC9C8|nr:DUF2141 domain-containing protein [Lyngbya sp. PCC 8106]EAW37943.1 hypothetical protein L8106_05950 [Lyngbya sp. PCC 8106]